MFLLTVVYIVQYCTSRTRISLNAYIIYLYVFFFSFLQINTKGKIFHSCQYHTCANCGNSQLAQLARHSRGLLSTLLPMLSFWQLLLSLQCSKCNLDNLTWGNYYNVNQQAMENLSLLKQKPIIQEVYFVRWF